MTIRVSCSSWTRWPMRSHSSARKLARRLGKPQSFVSAYENGQRRINLLEFLRIVEALNADPKRIFTSVIVRVTARRA
jgi:transcriptional regulator with XRE-family HTH domain